MPSPRRLADMLQNRCGMAADAIARADSPAAVLGAQVGFVRSLAVPARLVDPEGADVIVKRAAEQVAEAARELRAILERASAGPPADSDGKEAGPR
jgi:hypothetical protein